MKFPKFKFPSHTEALSPEQRAERARELRLFLFVTVVLFPLLSVILVGGLGAVIWVWQLIFGPPTYA